MPLGPKDTPRRTADVERFVGKIPGVKTWKLHRDPSGYFHIYGELEDGTGFSTQGISVYALHQSKLGMWPDWIMEVVGPEVPHRAGGNMARPFTSLEDHERWARSLSSTMKRIAESKRCLKCNRKSAMTSVPLEETHHLGYVGHVCRFCKHETRIYFRKGGQVNPRRRVTAGRYRRVPNREAFSFFSKAMGRPARKRELSLLRLRSSLIRLERAYRDDKILGWDQVLDRTEAAVFRYGLQRIFSRQLGTINSLRREYEGCKMPVDTAFVPAEDILHKAEKLLGIKIR